MLSIEPVHIHFHIPAIDPLGKEKVLGKMRFLPQHVAMSWRLKGSVFRGGKGEMRNINLPYGEIEHVELVRKWFRVRRIILRVSDPALLHEVPGVEVGKMILHIDARSREEAKKLSGLIDFKRSLFILDAHEQRLELMREPVSTKPSGGPSDSWWAIS